MPDHVHLLIEMQDAPLMSHPATSTDQLQSMPLISLIDTCLTRCYKTGLIPLYLVTVAYRQHNMLEVK
jgi:hypothetical protein